MNGDSQGYFDLDSDDANNQANEQNTLLSSEPSTHSEQRDDAWLDARTKLLWNVHYADVPRGYPIVTRFGTRARYRFGSIAARNGQTIILVNRLFAHPFVPSYVVDGTLGHELAHYAHGFGSGLPKLHKDAHRGGVVDKEMEKRGLGEVNVKAEQWRKAYWEDFYDTQCVDIVARKTSRTDSDDELWQSFLNRPERRTLSELRNRFALIAVAFGHPPDRLPFSVEWLHATRRQTAPSYWYHHTKTLRLHGLLADRRIPGTLLDFELAYWLARTTVGERWQNIHASLSRVGLAAVAQEALEWRRKNWSRYRLRHLPLIGP